MCKFNPEIHHRRSIRLKEYDYSQAGLYFITICTQNRERLFGETENGEMILNNAGQMVEKWFHELENKFANITCREHITMPNHTHFIIQNVNVGADLCVCPDGAGESADMGVHVKEGAHAKTGEHTSGEHTGSPLRAMIQWFKTMTTNEYIRHVKQDGWAPFPGKLWQRNYYEHIIRDEQSYLRIADYIINNSLNWLKDDYYVQ